MAALRDVQAARQRPARRRIQAAARVPAIAPHHGQRTAHHHDRLTARPRGRPIARRRGRATARRGRARRLHGRQVAADRMRRAVVHTVAARRIAAAEAVDTPAEVAADIRVARI